MKENIRVEKGGEGGEVRGKRGVGGLNRKEIVKTLRGPTCHGLIGPVFSCPGQLNR